MGIEKPPQQVLEKNCQLFVGQGDMGFYCGNGWVVLDTRVNVCLGGEGRG
jgi:hypothetical protein